MLLCVVHYLFSLLEKKALKISQLVGWMTPSPPREGIVETPLKGLQNISQRRDNGTTPNEVEQLDNSWYALGYKYIINQIMITKNIDDILTMYTH